MRKVGPMEDITVVDVRPQTVIGMRKRGKYQMIAQLLPQLFQSAGRMGARPVGCPMFICHETSAEEAKRADAEGNADVEVVVPVASPVNDMGEIKCYEVPGGRMARIVHKGPYDQMEGTYGRLFAWLGKNNKRPIGPLREVYLNDPGAVGPEETLTEVYVPIE